MEFARELKEKRPASRQQSIGARPHRFKRFAY